MTDFEHDCNKKFAAIDAEIDLLRNEVRSLKTITTQLLANMTPVLVEGHLPPLAQISRLECQVFHTPGLTTNQKRGGKTEWSLRLTAHVHGKRIRPDINVALYPPDRCLRMADHVPEYPERFAATAHNVIAKGVADNALLGMLRSTEPESGRPYIPSQWCLFGYFADGATPNGLIALGEYDVHFDFRPAKGSKSNSAVWYASWQPT